MQPYVLRPPSAAALPVLVSIPHTGTHLPPEFAARLASDAMRAQPMTDWHLHLLYDFLPALGITTLHATWSRFLSDLNRAPEDRPLYPGRFETGLIPRQTFDGEAVWREPPSAAEVARWRADWHAPYHARLAATLEDLRARFGRVVLIDAHSVASRANRLHPALQIEMAQRVYMDEADAAGGPAHPRFAAARERLRPVFEALARVVSNEVTG